MITEMLAETAHAIGATWKMRGEMADQLWDHLSAPTCIAVIDRHPDVLFIRSPDGSIWVWPIYPEVLAERG